MAYCVSFFFFFFFFFRYLCEDIQLAITAGNEKRCLLLKLPCGRFISRIDADDFSESFNIDNDQLSAIRRNSQSGVDGADRSLIRNRFLGSFIGRSCKLSCRYRRRTSDHPEGQGCGNACAREFEPFQSTWPACGPIRSRQSKRGRHQEHKWYRCYLCVLGLLLML